ncbi:MAG TPA: cell division protein ZapA [Cryomorphaceae bacterium]|nr:cell division protein ZapA [Cryomorphaceae bacterium]
MSELSIKVTIAGRIYPISVSADEEEMVRKAATDVDTDIKNLQKNYAVKDKQDLLAMTALQLATKLQQVDTSNSNPVKSADLDKLEQIVDSML